MPWSCMIDDALSTEHPCETCGEFTSDCICPECPECGEAGNSFCYEKGFLTYTTTQLIGQCRLRIAQLSTQLDTERFALERLLEQKETPK
jgi:hypothetical protein